MKKKQSGVQIINQQLVIYYTSSSEHDGDDDDSAGIVVYKLAEIHNMTLRQEGDMSAFLSIRVLEHEGEDADVYHLPEEAILRALSWWVGAPVPPREIGVLTGVAYEKALEAYLKEST